MAMGIIQFSISLFGNVPCPIIYGAVIDSTCLIWETICDKQGACSLYDPDAFRHFFLGMYDGRLLLFPAFSFPFQYDLYPDCFNIVGTTAGIMFLAFIMDVVVWHKANRIDIDPGSKARSDEYINQQPSITQELSV